METGVGRRSLAAVLWGVGVLSAQSPQTLTLDRACQLALHNHPRIQSASLLAQAARTGIAEARAAYSPTLAAVFTGVGAESNSAVAAGALTTSSLSSRVATGVALSQLVTDFGRTASLLATARLKAEAQDQIVSSTRARILLEVREAYFQVLSAAAVLKVARADLENKRLLLRQVRALAASAMKSTLDVSFAEVAVSGAELEAYRSENDRREAAARLAAAIGSAGEITYELEEEPLPPGLPPSPGPLVQTALKDRPDLAALSLGRDAARRFADAERRLRYPSIGILGTAGAVPAHEAPLRGTYSGAGVNVSVPILNGGLFASRRNEAELRAGAAARDVDDLSLLIARDVRAAWLEADDAFHRLDLTARLVRQANEALRLAHLRYDAGLGGIVELNQAEVSQTSAQIANAKAKYDYLARRSELAFVTGALR